MVDSRSIQGVLIVILIVILSAWLGVSVVTQQMATLLKVAGASLLIICMLLGKRIWLLLIFFNVLNVPLAREFSTTELGQGLFIGFSACIFLLRRLPVKVQMGELELWMLLLAACVVQVYLRNPVGLNILGSGAVGGKPYFKVALAWCAGMILGNLVVPTREIRWAMRLGILGAFTGVFLNGILNRLFGGARAATIESSTTAQGPSRVASLGGLGITIAHVVATFKSPLRVCVHPIWGSLILVSVAAAAVSGYRNVVAYVGLIYLIGIAYRGGFASLLVAGLSGAAGLAALALLNLAAPLPANIQRALSPFPGTWEERYVKDAEESTEWRLEMWEEALFTDYWIENKILGDGLGFSRREYQLLQAMQDGGAYVSMNSGMTQQQEAMMVTGGYHSGPVQCVRIVGYVGLIIVVLAMIRMAVHAHRQIVRCRGTEWYPVALYFGIPVIALPFMYVLVFGDFGRDVSTVFLFYGLVRLLEKNLPLPAYVVPKRAPYVLNRRPAGNLRGEHQPG